MERSIFYKVYPVDAESFTTDPYPIPTDVSHDTLKDLIEQTFDRLKTEHPGARITVRMQLKSELKYAPISSLHVEDVFAMTDKLNKQVAALVCEEIQ